MDNTIDVAETFTLEHPITLKGTEYTVLNARRPKAKDMRLLAMSNEKDPIGGFNKFLASLYTVPPDVIDELDLGSDYRKVQDWASDFLPKTKDAA